jgi:hypothetical protein
MNIGMLWFDNDTKSDLVAKIERASTYYQKKYGKQPDLCFVHPSMAPVSAQPANSENAPPPAIKAGRVEVRTTRSVLPNHLWIGVNSVNGSGANGNGANGHARS